MVSFICGATGDPELVIMATIMTAVLYLIKYFYFVLYFRQLLYH